MLSPLAESRSQVPCPLIMWVLLDLRGDVGKALTVYLTSSASYSEQSPIFLRSPIFWGHSRDFACVIPILIQMRLRQHIVSSTIRQRWLNEYRIELKQFKKRLVATNEMQSINENHSVSLLFKHKLDCRCLALLWFENIWWHRLHLTIRYRLCLA